jgi:hypothetical protein
VKIEEWGVDRRNPRESACRDQSATREKRDLKVAAMSAGVTDASSVDLARDWNNSCSRGWRTVVRQFWPGWSHAWAASDPRRAPDWR